MRILAFSILLLVFGVFGTMLAVIVYHLKQYGVPGDRTRFILNVFLAGSAALALLTITTFLSVPWDELEFTLPSL